MHLKHSKSHSSLGLFTFRVLLFLADRQHPLLRSTSNWPQKHVVAVHSSSLRVFHFQSPDMPEDRGVHLHSLPLPWEDKGPSSPLLCFAGGCRYLRNCFKMEHSASNLQADLALGAMPSSPPGSPQAPKSGSIYCYCTAVKVLDLWVRQHDPAH